MNPSVLGLGQQLLAQMPKKPSPKWQMALTPTTLVVALGYVLNSVSTKFEDLDLRYSAIEHQITKLESKIEAIDQKIDITLRAMGTQVMLKQAPSRQSVPRE